MTPSEPLVFAVVLNWNDLASTCACVRSLERVSYSRLKIVVVDNGSTDGSVRALQQDFKGHAVLCLDENGGYAKGNNEGIRYALAKGAEFILLLNNDVVVQPNFLQPLVEAAESNPGAGMLTGKAYLADSPGQLYATAGHFRRWRCNMAPIPRSAADDPTEITAASGCFLFIRKGVFEKVGFLNERFFLYFEDLEFSRRVSRGFAMHYVPASVIHHKSGAGSGWGSYTPLYLFYSARNRFLAFHGDPLWYRLYVFFFSVANALAKSGRIIADLARRQERHYVTARLRALWRGFREGITLTWGRWQQ
ncbi:MAG: glycosyltransferase family 2 protein [Bacteroidota bacterium]